MCDKCQSELERKFHEAFIRRHPKMSAQFVPQLTIRGQRVRVDFGWEEAKTIIEVDSIQHHSKPEDRARDKARDDRMHKLGWHTIRISSYDILESPDTAAELVYVRICEYIAGRTMEHHFPEDSVLASVSGLSHPAKQRVYPNPVEMMLREPHTDNYI